MTVKVIDNLSKVKFSLNAKTEYLITGRKRL